MKKLYSVGKVKTTIIARNTGEICKTTSTKEKARSKRDSRDCEGGES
jgi:hypothetical protein